MFADTQADSRPIDSPLFPGVSIVVPVYNSAETLSELVVEISRAMRPLGRKFEILLVDDGSADGGWDRIRELVAEAEGVRGFCLSRNFGQHNATLCGVRNAKFDACITLDDDLQHPPKEIPTLLEKLDEGWDVVYGRAKQPQHFWLRDRIAAATKSIVGTATGLGRVREQSPFRAFRTELRAAFSAYMGPDVLLDILLGWATTRFTSVEVEHRPLEAGRKTRYTARSLFDMGILALTAYSTRPLRIASWLGFALTVFGVAVFGYVVVLAVFFGSVPGFPFLASLVSIFSGTQLFTLGLFGEYLTRIFNRALGIPTYVVRKVDEPGRNAGDRDR
jgi:undecaprenyl-phosphate 4-deoxy-4-formamido-L-arabinose transferase